MSKLGFSVSYRAILAGLLVAAFFMSAIAPTADARRARNALTGAAIGAGDSATKAIFKLR